MIQQKVNMVKTKQIVEQEYPEELEDVIFPGLADLEELIPLPNNPKTHSGKLMDALMDKWGFVDRILINKTNNHIIAGNGRCERLLARKKNGKNPPRGMKVDNDRWFVTVDYIILPDDVGIELSLAIAMNRAQELGDWDHSELEKAFARIPNSHIDIVGFDEDLIKAMRAFYTTQEEDPEEYEELVDNASVDTALIPKNAKIVDYPEEYEEDTSEPPIRPSKLEHGLLRYIVTTDSLSKFRKALRLARSKVPEGTEDDVSTALELIANYYLDGNS